MDLNFDIWDEITSYLEYPKDEGTLRTLAVTSRMLSELALDIIWQSGEKLSAIVSVINSFAPSPGESILEYIGGGVEESDANESKRAPKNTPTWVLNKPLPQAACKRAVEYLTRIRKVTIFNPNSPRKEDFLWPILGSACPDSPGPLLPYLRHLEIGSTFGASMDCLTGAHMDCLTPLISPTLKILKIHLPDEKLLLPVLDLAKARGCDLKALTYRGPLPPRGLEVITSFENLQDVGMILCPECGPPTITVIKFLAALPSLRELTCDLAIFRRCATDDTFCHTNIQKLYISSLTVVLQELLHRCTFPSATEVKIRENYEVPVQASYLAFKGLQTSCPNAQMLDLGVTAKHSFEHALPLNFEHILPLLSLPVQELTLRSSELTLTLPEIRTISESWPNLHLFNLFVQNNLGVCALPALIAFSNQPHLNTLNLGFSPNFLLNDITNVRDFMATYTPTWSPRSKRFRLCFAYSGFPEDISNATRADKRSLVEFLLLMFPRLERFIFLSYAEDTEATSYESYRQLSTELREILSELRIERGDYDDW